LNFISGKKYNLCHYNGQRVTHSEFIRLKNLEKAIAYYDFLSMPVQSGFDYGANAVLKRIPAKWILKS
jgi:hypothetical protein